MSDCKHEHKVFANFSFASYPAKTPWICKDCGEEGIHTDVVLTHDSYESIKNKFKDSK